ncbi:MAG: hypothetical protein EA408_13060, partial [Marinilabiliales bacterium]
MLVFSGFDAFAASVGEEYKLKNDKKVFDLFAFGTAEEEDYMLENWMTDLTTWNVYSFEASYEADNVLEDWMTDLT